MTVQITIVGLGQIGSSIGLALKARLGFVVGHDKDHRREGIAAAGRSG
jgi:prephenate dehydrogenase